jgi:hypothetical protein
LRRGAPAKENRLIPARTRTDLRRSNQEFFDYLLSRVLEPIKRRRAARERKQMGSGDLTRQLLDGERVIWSGRPNQGLLLTQRDWLLVPFSLLWGGFAIFWEVGVVQTSAPVLFRFWGVPFVLIGLYLIAGRLLVDAWARSKTQYAVTNRRILIARSAPFGKFTAIALDHLSDVHLNEHANGRGTIRFGQPAPYWGRGAVWTPAFDATPQFLAVENSRRVFEQIQRAMRERA